MIKKTVGWGIRVRGRKKGITWGWGWVHVSFISNAFFISASTLLNFLMNRIWNVAELLLNKYRQNFTELLHIFSIFTSIRNLFTCLRLDLFVSFLPDLFFIFIFIIFFFFFFFLIRIYSMQGWTVTTRHGVTRKRGTKRLRHTGNLFSKNLQLKGVCWF